MNEETLNCINENVPHIKVPKKKLKFEDYISSALRLSTQKPSIREAIGTFWIDEYTFALKTSNLARSIGLKPNSINCGLRQHQLIKIGRVSPEDIKDFDDKRNWKMMQDKQKQFTRTKVESGYHDLLKWIKPIKQIEEQKSAQIEMEFLSFGLGEDISSLLSNEEEIDDFEVDFEVLVKNTVSNTQLNENPLNYGSIQNMLIMQSCNTNKS